MAKHKVAARPDLTEETPFWKKGSPDGRIPNPCGVFVFGVDEAGRGCLAGPVCAAVSCWSPSETIPVDVRDSKQMTEAQREACFEPVRTGSLAHGVGFGTHAEIDRWNILKANYLAVARALEIALRSLGEAAGSGEFIFLSDGNSPLVGGARFFVERAEFAAELPLVCALFARGFQEKCIVKGDSKVFSIAAASVLAKVTRDRLMVELHKKFPEYEFDAHKGYSTPRHVAILRERGPCSEHRRSFAPVTETLRLFPQA